MTTLSALPELTPETYINRELSNLQFQWRVLALAEDVTVPLLERIKFLAIVGNNLDEFFMVRVASYIQKLGIGGGASRPDGLSPAQIVKRIREDVTRLLSEQRRIAKEVLGQLSEHGIHLLHPSDLTKSERAAVRAYFDE